MDGISLVGLRGLACLHVAVSIPGIVFNSLVSGIGSLLELWNRSLNQIRFFRFFPILADFLSDSDFSRLLDLPIPQL